MRRRLLQLLPCLALAALLAPSVARAEFGPLNLVSRSAFEQAAEATEPALSADGRYVAFQGSVAGRRGIFREELASGTILTVATGDATTPRLGAAAAHSPSISADGRYVAFDTTAQLDPILDPQAASPDVYVADLATSPPTYRLASALDGSSTGLTYEEGGGVQGGAVASGRVAISADGSEVAFVTTAASNLTSEPGGSTEGTPTPAGQVVVRNLLTERTTLVSGVRDPASGAMETVNGADLPVPEGGVVALSALPRLLGASISADGTTVAWSGAHLIAQVPLLGDERQAIEGLEPGSLPYEEPLWRRIADGPAAPTRRIVGGGDPLAPGCPADGTLATPACQGPFPNIVDKNLNIDSASGWLGAGGIDGVPQLSANGRIVVLIGNPTEATNVFRVDMAPGLSRVQATRQLTREIQIRPTEPEQVINKPAFLALTGHIFDLAVSADGRRIAFASARQRYPLAPPNLVTPPPSQVGLVELYEIDLDGETLRRVTHGAGGEGEASLGSSSETPVDGFGAGSPTFDAAGTLLAFASTAANLVTGDGNQSSDVFAIGDGEVSRQPGADQLPPPLRQRHRGRRWQLVLTSRSLPGGGARVIASVPADGTLRVRIKGSPVAGGKPRAITAARHRARRPGTVRIELSLPARLRHLARGAGGFEAVAAVSFHHKGRKALHGKVRVSFHRRAGHK